MNARVRPGRFKLAWLIAGIAVIPLSAALTILVLSASSALLNAIDRSWYAAFSNYDMMILAIFWLISGMLTGGLQKALVKRYLRVDLGRWIVYSAIGALLAGAVAFPCLDGACLPKQFHDSRLPVDAALSIEFSIVALIYLTVFSAAQRLGLRRRARGTWRWVAAHLGSQILVLLVLSALLVFPGLSRLNMVVSLAATVLSVTVATGIVLQRMLHSNHDATNAAHDEWAYAPAPAEAVVSAESSVWDDAV